MNKDFVPFVKNKDFVPFTQQLAFSNKHKICCGRELVQ